MIVGPFCRGYISHLSESNNYACQTSDSIPHGVLCQYTGIDPYTYQQFQYSVGLVGLAKYVTSGCPPKLILNLKVLSKALTWKRVVPATRIKRKGLSSSLSFSVSPLSSDWTPHLPTASVCPRSWMKRLENFIRHGFLLMICVGPPFFSSLFKKTISFLGYIPAIQFHPNATQTQSTVRLKVSKVSINAARKKCLKKSDLDFCFKEICWRYFFQGTNGVARNLSAWFNPFKT